MHALYTTPPLHTSRILLLLGYTVNHSSSAVLIFCCLIRGRQTDVRSAALRQIYFLTVIFTHFSLYLTLSVFVFNASLSCPFSNLSTLFLSYLRDLVPPLTRAFQIWDTINQSLLFFYLSAFSPSNNAQQLNPSIKNGNTSLDEASYYNVLRNSWSPYFPA